MRLPGAVAPDGTYHVADGVDEQAAVVVPVGPTSTWATATSPPAISTTADA